MKKALITLFGLLTSTVVFASGAQFKTATYELSGSCEFKCAAGGGVTNQVAQKTCKKVQASNRLFVSRDNRSVLISNADPRNSNTNQFRYLFGKHEGPAHMPSLQMTDQYALGANSFVNVFDSSYADGTQSKTVIKFLVQKDGSIRKEETSIVSGRFLGIASGKVKSQKVCRYTER